MKRLIYTYALIKSLYDQGEDYIDSFWPFIIKASPIDRFMDSTFIQRKLRENFDLEIPLHVLRTIINRAKRRGYIEQKKGERQYKLTKKGLQYLDTLETDKEVERRISALLQDTRHFLNKHNVYLNINQIRDLFVSFLHKNIEPLILFINPSITSSELIFSRLESYEKLLIEYIKDVEQQKPENYKTLQDMILGSIISTILYSKESSEIIAVRNRKFKKCQIFFDTNFIFFILDLHTPEYNEPAKELFNLLKNYGFDLKVFDFTIDEICRVISGYPEKAHRYPTTIKVDTLYSSLKRKGWKKIDAVEFVMNIEDILHKIGLKIEWGTGIELKTYSPINDELINLIKNYKSDQDLFHRNHDLAIIEKIKNLRKKPERKIENSRAFLLTSDGRLSRFNFMEMGHKDSGTLCEVILDRLLTNILWLKNPNMEPPLKSIIAAYSRDFFIKRRIWDKFYEILKLLSREKKVNDTDISMLLYHDYIADVLMEFDEDESDKITPEFVLEEVEKAAKYKEEQVSRIIEKKEKEFLMRLKKEVSKKERELLDKVQEIKSSLKKSTESKCRIFSNILAFLLTILILGTMYGIYLVSKKLGAIEFLALLIPFSLGGSGIVGLWKKFKRYIEKKLVNWIYTRKLREVKLDEEKRD